jgi:primosomal protein N' (replication factor Y)
MNYTWAVPERFLQTAQSGCRVEVALGKNKRYAGIIKKLHNHPPELIDAKDILNVLDVEPVVHEQQLQLWEWMAKYYMCSEGEIMAAALPAHFKLSSETILVFNEEAGDDFTDLDDNEFVVVDALILKRELKILEVQEILDTPNVYAVINKLIQKRICYVWEALKETYKPKKEMYVLLSPQYNNEAALEQLLNEDKRLQRAEKQMELLLAYLHFQKTEGDITKAALLKKSGATEAQLKGLADKGILQIEKREVDRIKTLPKNITINFELSSAQKKSFENIKENLQTKNVCLLHGVTSGGKTEIYIRLIEEYIKQGKQVLYMLPEIALTSQTIRRLQKHFGGLIGVYHSKFSQNERVEIWKKVCARELNIILGARSAIFLPYSNLGLIICDEEHDASYKQMEPAPRYNARDTAVYLSGLFENCKVLLGSATPSLESYHNAVKGKFGFTELTERYGGLSLPPIHIIDNRRFKKKDIYEDIITPPLHEAIAKTVSQKRQVILFQNRRGYTPYQRCIACGWIPKCKHCDVSLTFHKFHNKLVCHYCGTTYPPMNTCAVCGSHDFVQKQFGTERIEELLQTLLSDANIGRMDIDSIRGKHAHDQLIQLFEQGKYDILVGTQMITKGLDFENVDLVGILDADGILSFADFRVNERAFQLMEQVSGRAGRQSGNANVLIQTAQPLHPVLLQVQQHDYKKMYETEIAARKQFSYPPFTRMIKIIFKHKIKDVVHDAAVLFANSLQNSYGAYITGPSDPVINRIRNMYLMEMILKLPSSQKTISRCKQDILQQIAILHQEKRYKSVVVVSDVDAM